MDYTNKDLLKNNKNAINTAVITRTSGCEVHEK